MQVRPTRNRSLRARRLYFGLVMIWGVVAFFISDHVADDMKFRINDLSVIYGAGQVMRDDEGKYFHVNADGKARQIFPVLEPPVYENLCLNCTLVTGETLAQNRDFCAAGVRSQLPRIDFELPCKSWAVMGDGAKVVAVTLFLVPVLLWPILRAILQAASGVKKR